jgi:drug/metabolite transporter (DMT)-like permease
MPVILKYFVDYIDGWTANGVRYGFAALLFVPVLLLHRTGLNSGRSIWKAAIVPSVINIIGQIGWAWSPYHNDATVISFVVRCAFPFSIVFGFWFLHRERALAGSRGFWLGAAATVLGVALMYIGGQSHGGSSPFGLILLLGTSACWGLYSVSVGYYMAGYPSLLAFSVICIYTAPGLVVLMLGFGDFGALGELSLLQWCMLLVSGILGISIGHVLMYKIIKELGPIAMEAGHSLLPLGSLVIAAAFLGERMSGSQWVGGIFLIAGSLGIIVPRIHLAKKNPEGSGRTDDTVVMPAE